jgi:hypothetical protein
MSYVFKPVEILNDVGFSLGVSQTYLELYRQSVNMKSFVGWEEKALRQLFDETIKSELIEFWISYINDIDDEIEVHEPHGRAFLESAKAVGLGGEDPPEWVFAQFPPFVQNLFAA